MPNAIFPEVAILVALRLFLFLACRKYLLRSLYSDLKTLSTDAPPGLPIPDTPGFSSAPDIPQSPHGDPATAMELESLPLPATHAKTNRLFPSDEAYLHSAVSRAVFSLSFSESSMMFFLLMFQGLDALSPRARLLNWKFSLTFLMATILVLVPLCVSLLVAVGTKMSGTQNSRSRFLGPRICLSLIPVTLYLFAVSKIPLPHALSSSDAMTAALSRLIVLGTIILGLLSGFGAISNSWAFIPMPSRSRSVPTDQDIATAEYALSSVRNDLRERTAEAERRAGTSAEGTWLSRVARGGDGHLQELQGLRALEHQMSRKLEALRQRLKAHKFGKTFRGRLFNFGGRIFATYCVARVVSSLFNVLLPIQRSPSTRSYPDLITDLLVHLFSLLSPTGLNLDDVTSFSRQLSLVLVGLIILTSIRRVLRGVTRALRVTSRNLGASLMLLLLAQLMGIYLLSTIVQLRASFPPPTKPDDDDNAITSNLFSTIPEYEVFGSLFDWSFLISAAASAFLRWGAEKVNGADDDI